MSDEFDIQLFQSTDVALDFTNGTDTMSIAGWALDWFMKRVPCGDETFRCTTVDGGITITDATQRELTVVLPYSYLSSVDVGKYEAWLRKTDVGSRDVLAHGFILVKPGD